MAELTWRRSFLLAALVLSFAALVSLARANSFAPLATLDGADDIQVPAGHKVVFAAYAEGVQVYRWNGTSWNFVRPEALLYDDEGEVVAIHYGGPTWESESGSWVKGVVSKRCTPDPNAIDWLLLDATASDGPGIFHRVSHIQRLDTVGGLPPTEPGKVVGEEARVAYAAEYVFYRKQR
jgi:uncharacterized protein DUF3455